MPLLKVATAIAAGATLSAALTIPVYAQAPSPAAAASRPNTRPAPQGPSPQEIAEEANRLRAVFDEAGIKAAAQAQILGQGQTLPSSQSLPPRIGPSISPEDIAAAAGDPAELSRA